MSKFNAWGIHHWHWGTISNLIAATLLFAWYFGDRNPWCGGYGVTLLVFGLWMWMDDIYQHERQRRELAVCGVCGGSGGVSKDCQYAYPCIRCRNMILGVSSHTYHSWVHKRYNKDAAQFGVWGALWRYGALLMGTGLVVTGVFWAVTK